MMTTDTRAIPTGTVKVPQRTLTTQGVRDYIRNTRKLVLIAPNQTVHDYDYVTHDGTLYVFHLHYSDEKITLDSRTFDKEVYEENGAIHFSINGEVWVLKEPDTDYILSVIYDEDYSGPLVPYEIKACLERAKELEIYLNQQLGSIETNAIKVSVIFRARVVYDEDDFLNGELPDKDDHYANYSYHFDAVVSYEDERRFDNIILLLDFTNEEALEYLMKGLNVFDRDAAS
jgi:hypothetical protein